MAPRRLASKGTALRMENALVDGRDHSCGGGGAAAIRWPLKCTTIRTATKYNMGLYATIEICLGSL
ncbi:hypothetical protein CPB86DRAFT_791995 [Serendipita vermifera]|nr:hypothetical protein CPB86DRAFT_791995 [Serendipita vermifera]